MAGCWRAPAAAMRFQDAWLSRANTQVAADDAAEAHLVGEPLVEGPAQLRVELLEVVQVHGGDEPAPVTEVGVDERAGDAGGVGDLLEGDLARVAASEHLGGRLDEQRAAGDRIEAQLGLAGLSPSAGSSGRSADGAGDGDRNVGRVAPGDPVDGEVAGHEVAVADGPHLRLLDARSAPAAPRAAGAEPAPAGRVDRRRELARQQPGRAPAATVGSGTGIERSSAAVYGCAGRGVEVVGRPTSQILPRYITATRSLTFFTTARSWAMNTA